VNKEETRKQVWQPPTNNSSKEKRLTAALPLKRLPDPYLGQVFPRLNQSAFGNVITMGQAVGLS
jgi:hypothetical protein